MYVVVRAEGERVCVYGEGAGSIGGEHSSPLCPLSPSTTTTTTTSPAPRPLPASLSHAQPRFTSNTNDPDSAQPRIDSIEPS